MGLAVGVLLLFDRHCVTSVFESADSIRKAPVASKRMAAAATGAVEDKEKRDGCEGRPAFMSSIWNVGVGRWLLAAAETSTLGLASAAFILPVHW